VQIDSVHLGECLSWLKTIPDAVADAIITDPPYSSGGMVRGDRMQATNIKYLQTGDADNYAGFSGDNRDQRAFGYWAALWLSEALRITKPGGAICCDSLI